MGEAWFMSVERRMFPELLGDISGLGAWELQQAVEEIASGTTAFGPYDEWREWYYYLLGELIPRSHESFVNSLLEILVTGFMALHPDGLDQAPYPSFRQDILSTLGRCMMEPQCWDGSQIVVGTMLHRSNNNPNRIWCWWDASGDFTASLFFCIKYLPEAQVSKWFASVLAIESPHWRAQILVWLVGAHDVLHGRITWPSQFDITDQPAIAWSWSHCLQPTSALVTASGAPIEGPFLSHAALTQVLDSTRAYFTESVLKEWLDAISDVPYLESELGAIPSVFKRLYVDQPA
jgi:hypothetical protein